MSEAAADHPPCHRCGFPHVLFLFRPLDLWLCTTCYQRARRAENRAIGQFDEYDLDAIETDFEDFDDLDDLKAALGTAFKRAHEAKENAAQRAEAARRGMREQLKLYLIWFAAPSLVIALAGWLFGRVTFMGAVLGWLGLQAMLWVGAAWISYTDWRQHGYLHRRHWWSRRL
jgi:hypothetical protein